jgi:hypothetical protein
MANHNSAKVVKANISAEKAPSNPSKIVLCALIEECSSGAISEETAKEAAGLLENLRRMAIELDSPLSIEEKLFLIKAGELATEASYFAENAHFDGSLTEEVNIRRIKTLAEDCLILRR